MLQEGVQWYQQGEYYKAIDVLEQVVDREPMRSRAHLILISSYLETGNAEIAEEKSKSAIELFPATTAFKWLLAESLLNQRKFREALEAYRSVDSALDRGLTLEPLQVEKEHVRSRRGQVHQALAAQAYQEERTGQAIRQMSQAAGLLRDSLQVQINLVVLYMEEKKYDEALQAIDRARDHFPNEVELLRMKASVFYQMEDQQALLEQFEEIYKNDPQNVDNGLVYAELLIAGQRSADGIEVLEDLLEKHPDEKRIYQMMADLNERRFNTEGKRAVLREMQKQFPDDPGILEQIADTYEREDKWSEARAVYDSLDTMTGEEIPYLLAKAQTYESQDSLIAATEVYEFLNSKNPDNETVLFRMGKNLENRQKWEEAVNTYRALLTVTDDRRAEALTRLGIALRNTGREEEAGEYLYQAIERGSQNPETYLVLSKIRLNQSENDQSYELGLQALEKSLRQMADQQQALETSIRQEGIYSQDEDQIRDLDLLNRLSEDSFDWFTNSFSLKRVEPVLQELADQYQTSGRLFYMIGSYYSGLEEVRKSQEFLEEAVRFTPRLMEAHLRLAELFEQQNEFEKAIAAYERAGALDPEMPEPYSALIRLNRNQGKLDQLCDRWLSRFRALPGNEVLREHLIEALQKADRFEEAREILGEN